MTAATLPTDHADTLVLLLGRRQAEVMRFFWARGQATVQELHHWLRRDSPLAYTTVATMCVRPARKGLLHQQRTRLLDGHVRHGTRYLYTPRMSEQEFIRTELGEQLAHLLAHEPALVYEQVGHYGKPQVAREAAAHELSASPDLPLRDVASKGIT
jgi:predicted transcriptional regulator